MQDLLRPDFDWSNIFERFYYSRKYARFIKICLSASDQDALGDWAGWIKSRFRCLLVKVSISFHLIKIHYLHSRGNQVENVIILAITFNCMFMILMMLAVHGA